MMHSSMCHRLGSATSQSICCSRLAMHKAAPLQVSRSGMRHSLQAHTAAASHSATELGVVRTLNKSRRKLCTAVAAAAEATPSLEPRSAAAAASSEEDILQDLLVWLLNNGVVGIGTDDSKIALYEDETGDRGVIAVEDIPAGEQLVRVPLRLAITDVLDEQQRQQLVGQGVLWQDRLVAQLLQQVKLGKESPWHPYVKAMPKCVPSALESFSIAEAAAVQLPAVTAAIQEHEGKMAASWQACRPDAISGSDLRTYRWAHSVVMSRTFGNAAQQGGIGVRMLVPLIDMLNHASDETDSGLLADAAVARDNVRWDVVSPTNSPSKQWEMVLSTTQAIPAESPLLLSYFEGSNDEFLLHYGFVPPSNPKDTVQLFSSITAALEHMWQQDITQGKSQEELAPLYRQALDAGLAALQDEVATAAAGADDSNWGPLLDALEPIKVASGSRISSSLIAALEVLHQGDMAAVEAAVAGLAWQQLAALPTSLMNDLALLVADAQQSGDGEALQLYAGLLRHYTQAAVPDYAPAVLQQLSAAAAASSSGGNDESSSGSSTSAVPHAKKKKRAVPGPPQAAAAAAEPLLDFSSLPLSLLVGVLLPTAAAAGSRATTPLSYAEKMAVKFRVSKKMLLMDVVLAARVPLDVLEQQRLKAAAAAAAVATATQIGCSNNSQLLPWQAA